MLMPVLMLVLQPTADDLGCDGMGQSGGLLATKRRSIELCDMAFSPAVTQGQRIQRQQSTQR